ncbi:MAG TPA: hypothetical protein VF575_01300 [Candidatus Saccharimonadales bacterium]
MHSDDVKIQMLHMLGLGNEDSYPMPSGELQTDDEMQVPANVQTYFDANGRLVGPKNDDEYIIRGADNVPF